MRPRIRYKTFQLAKEKGGLALPDIKNNFWAAQIKKKNTGPHMQPIPQGTVDRKKNQISSNIPLQSIIGDGAFIYLKETNPWIKVSLKIWLQLIREYQAKEPYQLIKWIVYDFTSFHSQQHRFWI